MALQASKKLLRDQLKNVLKNISPEEKARQSEITVNKLLQSDDYRNSQRIGVYLSRDIEIDTKPILQNIFSSEKECFIPKYDSKSTKMDMIKLNSLEDYENLPLTSWKIKQPSNSDVNRENALETGGLDLLIVPGIGFTSSGDRIGNGKGYYDNFMKQCMDQYKMNLITVGLAFKEQIVSSIPTDEHDVKIDKVLYSD